ncbi:MAG TPA: cell division topological specificity factor MinE [Candidatus Merdicola faecigallinarum]|uniref:Cell division topological specificity factor n=1 Tax=Candidatus Merdicola faecigallinarum TaxID=2840862 RepID=A0A9D1S962_9FIRM|nr:cell division topological specificity factor MinE [Candidatus Merdicola faecigallinarum]
MFEGIKNFFKKIAKTESQDNSSKETAKERLHLVLMQDRANVSADFLEMMKQEIIEVIKKYIDVDENAIDVRLTNKTNDDGTNGAPALYANIPIISIKEGSREYSKKEEQSKVEEKVELKQEEKVDEKISQEGKEEQNQTESEKQEEKIEDVEKVEDVK